MRRGVIGMLDGPSAGFLPALVTVGGAFFVGGLAGCGMACWAGGLGGEALRVYLEAFLASASAGGAARPELASMVWELIRWPLLTFLLGFTALGVIGVPLLFGVRGFLLSFSITSFVRLFGGSGSLLAFLVFGISGCLAVPALFVLGVQSLMAACRLAAGGTAGEGWRCAGYGRTYFVRCGACACALCVCMLLEYLAVPALVAGFSAALLA